MSFFLIFAAQIQKGAPAKKCNSLVKKWQKYFLVYVFKIDVFVAKNIPKKIPKIAQNIKKNDILSNYFQLRR